MIKAMLVESGKKPWCNWRFKNAKNYIFSLQKTRKKSIPNYQKTQKVLLVGLVKHWEQMQEYAKFLREKQKIPQISTAVFLSDAKEEETCQKAHFLFYPKQLRFWNKCLKKSALDKLDQENFDLLVDFSNTFDLAVKCVVAKSSASSKVGILQEDWKSLYDFCIELPEEQNKDFIYWLNHFIDQINNKS